jgi:hypothetical protein
VTDPELVRREIIEGIEAAANLWRMPKLKNQCTERTLKGVMSLLKGHIHAKGFFANRPRYVIHAANCMIVFDKDGSYHEEAFAPEFRSRNASPIPFKEDAECHPRAVFSLKKRRRKVNTPRPKTRTPPARGSSYPALFIVHIWTFESRL